MDDRYVLWLEVNHPGSVPSNGVPPADGIPPGDGILPSLDSVADAFADVSPLPSVGSLDSEILCVLPGI